MNLIMHIYNLLFVEKAWEKMLIHATMQESSLLSSERTVAFPWSVGAILELLRLKVINFILLIIQSQATVLYFFPISLSFMCIQNISSPILKFFN